MRYLLSKKADFSIFKFIFKLSVLKKLIIASAFISSKINANPSSDKPDASLLLAKLETIVQEVLSRESHPFRISEQGRFEIKNSAGSYTPLSVNTFVLDYETPLEFRPLNCPTNFRVPTNCRLKVKSLLGCESENRQCQDLFRRSNLIGELLVMSRTI
jgi:hypothetical protein